MSRNARRAWGILFRACAALLALSATGCTSKRRVWVYTSLYKEVIAEMTPALERALPDIEVRWYQGSSETVAARVNTELVAGRTQADLILTSDPFWYMELKKAGKLASYESPAARAVPAEYRDPDGAFATVRICVMVLGYNPEAVPASEAPRSWADLRAPRWRGKLSMGSPVESGTTFTAAAMLVRGLGWDWLQGLRSLDLIAAGGNSSVINRIETRERPVGMALLENILKARKKGSSVVPVYPSDGAVPIPSPIALMADSRNPELARRVYDWFFGEEAQRAVARGNMYSPLPGIPSPDGAMPWSELSKRLMKWDGRVVGELYAQRSALKTRLSETVIQ